MRTLLFLLFGLLQLVLCKGKAVATEQREESDIHGWIKIGFWFFLGVTLGVYFQARLNLKELMRPAIDILLYGLFIGVAVYTLSSVGDFLDTII